ncbi:MAG TPA: L-histidine N(alpha)-methyltransferase [Sphingobacterium sp.]|nr:L-histidine N(alpha)-methyltransferase [Sphingobacterium sp.]
MNGNTVINRPFPFSARQFYDDVVEGLSAPLKRLSSKYFYDARGDEIFRQIMQAPEYYLFRCEREILERQRAAITEVLFSDTAATDLVELGAGDGTKTYFLLEHLVYRKYAVVYRPIDISQHILHTLTANMQDRLPELRMDAVHAEYFDGLETVMLRPSQRVVVLFLGANIGNMAKEDAEAFCRHLRASLRPGDKVLIGFDLVKHPRIIQRAYDDRAGLTAAFNINLLHRINTELGADFNTDLFEHYCTYVPETGQCVSYLVSLEAHQVNFPDRTVQFDRDELIHMEISQKYRESEITDMASKTGFLPLRSFYDERRWFVDVVWEAV